MQDNDILNQVNKIRERYKTEFQDDENDVELSFIDDVNNLIQKIFKDDPVDVYTALTPNKLEEWKSKRSRWWKKIPINKIPINKIAMFMLLITITGFLVSEAVGFYAVDGVITSKVWIKAILTEICFIFVSAYRAEGKLQTSMVTFARVGIFALMLFVISSEVTQQGFNQINEINVIDQKVQLVEEQIKKKEELVKFYIQKGWGINAAKQEEEKQILVEELIKLKNEQIGGKNESASTIILYKTWARAFFRIVLMFISILISRKLFKI